MLKRVVSECLYAEFCCMAVLNRLKKIQDKKKKIREASEKLKAAAKADQEERETANLLEDARDEELVFD